jgi:hypothetical protein
MLLFCFVFCFWPSVCCGSFSEVTCLQFHPYGNVLATGCADNSIKLWDIRSNTLLQHYSAHDLAVSSIAFHPSGNFLLSTSLDSSIRLWDLRQGHQLYTIHGHPSPVHACAFNGTGDAFVTGGADQRVITWNTNISKEVANAAPNWAGQPLPQVGNVSGVGSDSGKVRGKLLPSQVTKPSFGPTGQLSRNRVEAGKRDAFYEANGITSGPIPTPQPSGPLPPTDMAFSQRTTAAQRAAAIAQGLHPFASSVRRGPPAYTFRTGENAGQVIGGRLEVDETGSHQRSASPSAPEAECGNGVGTCDYQHSHISSTSGLVHSYAEVHDPRLLEEAAARAKIEEEKWPGGAPGIEEQPLEEQLRGFHIPGLTSLADTGRATTRAGIPGPSVPNIGQGQGEAGNAPNTSRSQHAGPPSFAASAAGVQPNQIIASVARGGGSSSTTNPSALNSRSGDEYVYSFQSDRFLPSNSHPNQAKTAEARALKNESGVDIFAIPPADHIQRLPEQLAHTMKYITTQLDQISRVCTNYALQC